MHKKTYALLIIMVALAGLLLALQIRRSQQITVTRNPVVLISEESTFIPISDTDPVFGNPGADKTIIEFMDFNCGACLDFYNTTKEFILAHPQEIRLVWKDAPQPKIFSKDAALAHRAGWCVFQQDERKFWQFADTARQNKNNLNESGLKIIAQGLNLDVEKLWQCTNSDLAKQKIEDSSQLMKNLGLKSLPIIFVNNKLINTKADINLKDMLETFIKQ
jgi:protein-disulfide isomerase